MFLAERDKETSLLPGYGIDLDLVQQQVLQEIEGETPAAPGLEHIARIRISLRGAGRILEEAALVVLEPGGVRQRAVDHADRRNALPADRLAERVDAEFAEIAQVTAR